MIFDADGHKKRHSFHRVMMRSAAKLSYEQAQAAIDGNPDATTRPLLDPVLKPLCSAYGALARAQRPLGPPPPPPPAGRARGEPLAIDLPERKVILNADGSVDRIVVPP